MVVYNKKLGKNINKKTSSIEMEEVIFTNPSMQKLCNYMDENLHIFNCISNILQKLK